eukprot:2202843-Heterocapsa_arctica.AAC.1
MVSSNEEYEPRTRRWCARVRTGLQAALDSSMELGTGLEDEAVTPAVRRQYEKAEVALIK